MGENGRERGRDGGREGGGRGQEGNCISLSSDEITLAQYKDLTHIHVLPLIMYCKIVIKRGRERKS